MRGSHLILFVELIPFTIAFLIFISDFWLDLGHKNYFLRAKMVAVDNIRQEAGYDLSLWPFHCFREALIRRAQSNFLGMLCLQCVFTAFSSQISANISTLTGITITLIIVGTALLFGLLTSIVSEHPFAWYYPRDNSRRFNISWWRAFLGRLGVLLFVLAVVGVRPDLVTPAVTKVDSVIALIEFLFYSKWIFGLIAVISILYSAVVYVANKKGPRE